MDFISITTAILGSSAISALIQWFSNWRMSKSQANNSDADYAEKIIKQANDRVDQYKADMELVRAERDRWQAECKGQRTAKQEWRSKYEEQTARVHALELSLKDMEGKYRESEWHRCETNGCHTRVPPRKRQENGNTTERTPEQ